MRGLPTDDAETSQTGRLMTSGHNDESIHGSDLPTVWRIRYDDHSGNRYRFGSGDDGAAAYVSYQPMTPERSSSGIFTGGEPHDGALSAAQASELLTAVLALESASDCHAETRMKGTGSFAISEGAGKERRFLVRRGARLRAFDERAASLRAPS